MNFTEAELRFRELQLRVQRGEGLSEEEYEQELAKLIVQDQQGTFWSPDPVTGRWAFFNGTEWVPGNPPNEEPVQPSGRDRPIGSSTVAQTLPPLEPDPYTRALPDDEPAYSPETIPAYSRSGDQAPRSRPGGLLPRPVRASQYPVDLGGDRTWLPIGIGAIALLLCGMVVFFGVRPLFVASAPSATATLSPTRAPTTQVAVVVPTTLVPATTSAASPVPPTRTAPPATSTPIVSSTPLVVTGKATENVNVRGGPGTNYPIVGKLLAGTTAVIVARSDDSQFLEIQYPDPSKLAWVSARFIEFTSGDFSSLPVASAPPPPQATPQPTVVGPTPRPTITPRPSPTETPLG